MAGRQGPGDTPANRVPDEAGSRNTALVHQRQQQRDGAGVGVVALRIGPAQATSRQIDTQHAEMLRQLRRPHIPSVQAGTKAVEQEQHRLIRRGLRRAVAHMQAITQHGDHVTRCFQVLGF